MHFELDFKIFFLYDICIIALFVIGHKTSTIDVGIAQ